MATDGEKGTESGMARQGPERALGAVELALPYPKVSGNGKTRLGPSGVFSVKEARDYDLAVKSVVVNSRWWGIALANHIEVHFDAWPPDLRERDEDNVMKVVKDALTKTGLWKSDGNRTIRRVVFTWHDIDKEEAPEGVVIVCVKPWSKSQ